LLEVGLGQLGLTPDVFWQMTPYEFLCAQKGYFELYKMREQSAWHRTIELINIQLPKGKRIDPKTLFVEKVKDTRTKEERMKEIEKLNKITDWRPLGG
jgi:hypothetical protein